MKKTSTKKKPISLGATIKKTRMKEAKETKVLFETIAKKLLIQNENNFINKMETICNDMINKKFTELRQDIIIMESAISSRINQIEHKVNDISFKLNDFNQDIIKQNTIMKEDLLKVSKDFTNNIDNERTKRLTSIKKIQTYIEQNNEQCKSLISNINNETMNHILITKEEVNKMNQITKEDIINQSKDINKIKETVDDLLLKRYGFMPGNKFMAENLSSSYNQGIDAGMILDNLSIRIKNLESFINEDTDQVNIIDNNQGFRNEIGSTANGTGTFSIAGDISTYGGMKNSVFSPAKMNGMNINKKITNNKMKKIEDNIYELRHSIQSCEADIQQVKATVISQLRKIPHSNHIMSPSLKTNLYSNDHYYNSENNQNNNDRSEQNHQDIKILNKKIKKLSENTTKACRSLSNGISDIQQATLNLYTWTDATYDTFGKISQKLGYTSNICPIRAKVYIPPKISSYNEMENDF